MGNVQSKTIITGAKYAAVHDFEILAYVTTKEEAEKILEAEKKRLDFLTICKKKLVRKILKGKLALPSESQHFYVAEVIG